MEAPCKNCKDRHCNCHSECKNYQSYNAMCKLIRNLKHKEAEGRGFWYDVNAGLRRHAEAKAKKHKGRYGK